MGQTKRLGLALAALGMALTPACFSQGSTCLVAQGAAAGSRTTSESQLVVLPGSGTAALPASLRGADAGMAPANARLERMILLLEAPARSGQALDVRLKAQLTPGGCEFHHWMSAGQFADTFANSATDVRAVAEWLEGAGFTVATIPAGRGWIEFSGTAAQVEQAFHTSVHRFAGRTSETLAIAHDIWVPAGLRPVIRGLVSLDGARSAPAITGVTAVDATAEDLNGARSPHGAAALTPQLAQSLLHLNALHAAGARGAGESIAVVGRAAMDPADAAAFRAAFGLPASAVTLTGIEAAAGGMAAGVMSAGVMADRAGVTLAVEWAGVAAPEARIVVDAASSTAATDGVDLALADAVGAGAAHTIVVGYQGCEAGMSAAHRDFYRAVYRQAGAEGIAVIAASGDSGAAACQEAGSPGRVTTGYAVNALASTPWNTAVSAAGFDATGALGAWSAIPEASSFYASGGGLSGSSARPDWQPAMKSESGPGRLLPDLTLPAAMDAAANRGLAFCFGGAGSECRLMRAGGSFAATAVFGGISALLAEKYGPQGNLAAHLYALSGFAAFEDVRSGNARMGCAAGTPGCGEDATLGFDAGDGFDLATGLGMPLAAELVRGWANFQSAGTTVPNVAVAVSPTVANMTYNPSASITVTATVSGSGATPTGTVQFSDVALNGNLGTPATLDSTATASATFVGKMPTGGNNITATYSGDATYAAATSQPVTVTIQPSTTSMTVTPSTTTAAAGSPITVTVTLAVVTPPAGTVAPSGKVTLNVDGAANSTATLVAAGTTNTATFNLTTPSTAGVHTLQAIYGGDANYTASTSPAVTITNSKGATVTTLTAAPTTLTPNIPETLTATVAPLAPTGGSNTITGTISFYDGALLLGTATLAANTASLPNVTLSTAKPHQITAVYSGDLNWATSTSSPVSLTAILLTDTVTLTVNPALAGPGQVVTLTATVTPTVAPLTAAEQNPMGNVVFYNGTQVIATVALTAGPNNTGIATLLNATLPSGNDVITAYYVGDLYYAAGTSNAVTLTVQDFTIVPAGTNPPTNLNIIKGQSGIASFVVTGEGGFNSQIQVVCAVQPQDDMTCTPNPQQVTPTGTVTFTIQTYLTGGPTGGSVPGGIASGGGGWGSAAGGTALAGMVVMLLPFKRRPRWLAQRGKRVAGLLLLAAAGLGAMGCSSVSGTPSGKSTGTPLGVATVKITATAYVNNVVVSHSVYLTVNVLPPQ